MHIFLFTKPPRENWFQYVRRVYATTINFPCISTLTKIIYICSILVLKDFKRELLVFHLVLYARVIGSSFGVYKQELLGVRSEFVNESYWYLF